MPITVRRKGTAPIAEPEGPSMLRRVLAGGTRVGAGVLATPVGMVPSPVTTSAAGAIGALGELLAQGIEGSEPNFKRALVEGGVAAVPFGKLIKGGRALQSAMRSGALSGVGEAGRELSMGEGLSPGSIGLTTLLGGVTGGILGKLTPPLLHATGGVSKAVSDVPRATGRLTRGGDVIKEAQLPLGRSPQMAKEPSAAALTDLLNRNVSRIEPAFATTPEALGAIDRGIQEAGKTGLRIRGEVIDDIVNEARALAQAERLLTSEQKAARKATDQVIAQQKIDAMLAAGAKPMDTLSETSVGVPVPGGTRRVRTSYRIPKAEDIVDENGVIDDVYDAAEDLVGDTRIPSPSNLMRTGNDLENVLRGGIRVETPSVELNPTNLLREGSSATGPVLGGMQVAGVSAEDPRELAQLFKTRVGATGANYRNAKAAAAAGEIPTADFARTAHKAEQDAMMAAKGGPMPVSPEPAPSPSSSWVDEQSQLVDELMRAKQTGGGDTTMGMDFGLSSLLSGLQRNPETAAMLGLGTAGAIVGGVTDPLNDPLSSAGAGFAAGLASPIAIDALSKLGISQNLIPTIAEKVKSPQGIAEVVKQVGRSIPQLQRFNLLADEEGLPANALVGPYASGVLGTLTKGLSGDARGWAALRELANTPGWFKEVLNSRNEAIALMQAGEAGRAETELLSFAGDPRKNPITWPGVAMTSGDLGSRRILMRHGFSEDEARVMTMTSEPELQAPHAMAEFGKRSPFLQFLFPFRRTPANILEQGAHRIPGLGVVTQSFRKTPDSLREQAVQQGLGAGFGAAGYVAGQEMDPETARWMRRYITNASGQFSLPTALGLAAGQAVGSGRPIVSGGTLRAVDQALPLPSAEPLTDLLGALGGGRIPRGAVPAVVHRQLYPPNASTTLRPITIRRR